MNQRQSSLSVWQGCYSMRWHSSCTHWCLAYTESWDRLSSQPCLKKGVCVSCRRTAFKGLGACTVGVLTLPVWAGSRMWATRRWGLHAGWAHAWGSITQGLAPEDHAGLLWLLYCHSFCLCSVHLCFPRTGTGRRFIREAVNLSTRRLAFGGKLTLIWNLPHLPFIFLFLFLDIVWSFIYLFI